MSEKSIQIGLYRILRKLSVPREEISPEFDFDRDYFFTEAEKMFLFNLFEFRFKVKILPKDETKIHNARQLYQLAGQAHQVL